MDPSDHPIQTNPKITGPRYLSPSRWVHRMRCWKSARLELMVLLGVLAVTVAVLLHACSGQDAEQPTDPQFAVVGTRTLTINGGGTGSGTVTAPPTGNQPQLNCVITSGQAAATGCVPSYPAMTVVTLTATPASGHTFTGWSGACTGKKTCTLTLGVKRNVTANFAGPPQLALTVTGGGTGDGIVSSQPDLSPPIDCTIAGGVASGTGCRASYPDSTIVTLTATPAPGHTFGWWGGDCATVGSAPSCQLTMSGARSANAVFMASGSATEAALGKWGQTFATPIVAIHMALLPNSRVLMWGPVGTQPWTWDPTTYSSDPETGFVEKSTGSLMFCSGQNFLGDGRLLVIGGQGTGGLVHGIKDVNIFDSTGWAAAPPMHYARWYPTAAVLPNGDVVAMAGTDENKARVQTPEVYNGSTWRDLTGATLSVAFYPRLFVEPKLGRLFHAGEQGTTRYMDPNANGGTGGWTTLKTRMAAISREYGSAVMLDGKVLYVGGGGAGCPDLPTNTAEIIDLNAATPTWRSVGSMAYRRRQLNLTILPDGKVLATGGTSACGADNPDGTILPAELWDPVTEQWSVMGSMRDRRNYHSTAILLPDGQVLVSGSNGILTAQVFTPPYLFNPDGTAADRPTYTLNLNNLGYNQSISLSTPNAASIRKLTLIRLSAVTHAHNQSQRLVTLGFTAAPDGQSLTFTTPASGNLAPPGPYLLFILNDKGVPSVAQIVNIR
jgi:hypothetical protein